MSAFDLGHGLYRGPQERTWTDSEIGGGRMHGAEPATTNHHEHDLNWLLENLRERTPAVQHVLVLSKDGLRLCFTADLDIDTADHLSAIASGIQSLTLSASAEFGSGLGAGQSMVEYPGGILLIVPAGDGAHLAVVAGEAADVGLIGHNMNELVEQIGGFMTARPRRPGPFRTP